MKRSFGILCWGVLFLSGAVLGQTTLTGYTNSVSVQGLSSQQVYEKLARWRDIIDPNLDVLPSQEETEIYRELVRAEGGGGLITDFSNVGSWDYSNRCRARLDQIQKTKDLYWLPALLDSADALLAKRKKAGFHTTTTGRGIEYDCWIATHENDRLAPLNSGKAALPIALAAHWILDHPELYTQTAPTNAVIPITVPSGTYYDRAEFYLLELKKSMEVFLLSGLWWEFDTTAEAGWIFDGGAQKVGADLQALYPNGIDIADVRDVSNNEGMRLLPYNRTCFWLSAYYQTALGLHRLDQINGTSLHDTFYHDALECLRKSGNWWRFHRRETVEAGPNGTSYTWPYAASQDSDKSYEDSTHFQMDLDPMTHFTSSAFFTSVDLEGVSGSIYSRWFDHESQVYYTNMGRSLSRDSITKVPKHGYWWLTPGYLGWVGEFGTQLQARGLVALSLEMLDEQMRKCAADSSYRSGLLGRKDTRRSRNAKGPFEIYDLKMARAARGLTPTGNTAAPVIDSVSPSPSFSILESTPLGTVVGSVSASDADAGESVSYWITKGNVANRFKIDPITGEIRVNKYYPLNDEEGGAVTPLEITVMDDGVPMQHVTTNITITLIDDRTSPFVVEGQEARFTPNLLRGDSVMMVDVIDTVTNKFFLGQSSDLFTIDSDGSIRMKKQGGTPGKEYKLKIGVTQDVAEPLISYGYVTLMCEDSFIDASASTNSGAAPLAVNFSCSHKKGGTIVSADWDFGDGTITNGANIAHTFQNASVTNFVSVEVVDHRGVRDRAALSVAVQGTPAPPNGLLAHYSFSEGSGSVAYDSSGLGNHGTISGDGYDTSSPAGTGFKMGDSRYVRVPSSVYGQISDAVTISFYAKGAQGLYDWNHPVYAADSGGGKRIGVHLPWGANYIWDAGGDRLLKGLPIPKKDAWTLWTFAKDATTGEMWIYTNGVEAARSTGKTGSMSGINEMYIGCSSPGRNEYTGSMDEIRIYNRALSASEVAALSPATPLTQNFQVSYHVGPQGTLQGDTNQTIAYGGNGSPVYAEPRPHSNQFFSHWSDGRVDNPRTDLNIRKDLSVTAIFSAPKAPRVWYKFDETSGSVASDSSGNGLDGIVSGPMFTTTGKYGGALEFLGTGEVTVPLAAFDTVTNELTVAFWLFDPDASAGGQTFVYGPLAGFTGYHYFQIGNWSQTLAYTINGDKVDTSVSDASFVGAWHHFAFTKNAATGEMITYMDGVEINRSSSASMALLRPDSFLLGRRANQSENFTGSMDDFRLYDRVLAEWEINHVMNGNDQSLDTDGDGFEDSLEIRLGTDPNDPNSFFRITEATVVNGRLRLRWPSATGVTYKVWQSDDLTNWSMARDWANALTTPTESYEVDPIQAKRFYKIEAKPAP